MIPKVPSNPLNDPKYLLVEHILVFYKNDNHGFY